MRVLLRLRERVKGRFMQTIVPLEMIEACAERNGWIIHRVERTKVGRRQQKEWMGCNYMKREQVMLLLPDRKTTGRIALTYIRPVVEACAKFQSLFVWHTSAPENSHWVMNLPIKYHAFLKKGLYTKS